MSRNTLVERRIRFLVASSLVILLAFSVRLVDVQAVRAQGIAAKVTNELTKRRSCQLREELSLTLTVVSSLVA